MNNTAKDSSSIAITGYGLNCVTGNQDFALFGAVAGLMGFSKPNTDCIIPNLYGDQEIAPLCVVNETTSDSFPAAKIPEMLSKAFAQAIDNLTLSNIENELIIYCITPCRAWPQSRFISEHQVKLILVECLEKKFSKIVIKNNAKKISIIISPNDHNTPSHLEKIRINLLNNPQQTVLFGGVDSYVSTAACMKLRTEDRILTAETNDGLIPGEAACFLILKNTVLKENYLATIHNIATPKLAAVTKTSKVDNKATTTKLDTLITETLQTANISNTDIDCIVSTMTAEKRKSVEWYYAQRKVWPNKLPEQQRVAIQLGELEAPGVMPKIKDIEELNLNYSLGETGAASLPLQLLLGCARFDFNYPKIKNCLVCYSGLSDSRGAILLQND